MRIIFRFSLIFKHGNYSFFAAYTSIISPHNRDAALRKSVHRDTLIAHPPTITLPSNTFITGSSAVCFTFELV